MTEKGKPQDYRNYVMDRFAKPGKVAEPKPILLDPGDKRTVTQHGSFTIGDVETLHVEDIAADPTDHVFVVDGGAAGINHMTPATTEELQAALDQYPDKPWRGPNTGSL